MNARPSSQRGLTLVEVAIVVGVMALITGVMAPAGFDLVAQARSIRVQQDCENIRHALVSMLTDLGRHSLSSEKHGGFRLDLLVSNAPAPRAATPGEDAWSRPVDDGSVDLLSRHLVTNDPGVGGAGSWPLPTEAAGLGWRGAYLPSVPDADPWGHRYAVNVRYLGLRPDVLVLSAGRDGLVETPFEARNLSYGGDDVAALVK